ncbi:MAG: DUF1667 domain-containing protein [Synergistaceae bacterium]|jgi:CxxC motif-containing protein|nr:DUF1667 domain-containing protein [Synergistaceae bacterium]
MSGNTVKGEFVCVVCPNGCFIEAEYEEAPPGGEAKILSLTGNRCQRGEAWVSQELSAPMRTIATSIPVRGGDFLLASVRTKNPIPLARVRDVMDEIRKQRLDAPLHIGQTVLRNPSGTDTEIIVTREVQRV